MVGEALGDIVGEVDADGDVLGPPEQGGQSQDRAMMRADAAIGLARGEAAAAVALLDRQLSLISRSGLLAVPLLAQLVEAQLACDDNEGAPTTAAELENLAAQTGNARVTAIATAATGRVALVTAAPMAIERLEGGVELFARLRMPYEEARARLDLATATADRGSPGGAHDACRESLCVPKAVSA